MTKKQKGMMDMANKTTRALTRDQYKEIIETIQQGFAGQLPNERVATALMLEANLGLRISDVLQLRLCDIIRDGERYRLDIIEQKTEKRRRFTVPAILYQFIENYCYRHGIGRAERIFPITARNVQIMLQRACDYLGHEGISTHSFRKFYATEIYNNSGYNIALVQHLLQHRSAATTQRYIGIEPREVEEAILGHLQLL